jgi:hypothetical protein
MRAWLGLTLVGVCGVGAGGCGSNAGDDGFGAGDLDSGGTADGTTPGSDGGGSYGDGASLGDSSSVHDGSGIDVGIPDGGDGSTGDGGGGADSGCPANSATCNGTTATVCANGVTSMQSCTGATPFCANGYGCVACMPGSATCSGSNSVVCLSDGSGTTSTACDPALGETCANGYCAGDCAGLGSSYIGCEYYAVTMSNTQLDQTTFNFGVSISNTSSLSATITITGPNAFTATETLAAGAIAEYTLPWVATLSMVNTTTRANASAYHIKSTEPVTVYQFNGYEYEVSAACASDLSSPPCHSFTNDASLLIPVNAMTGNYYVMAGADWHSMGEDIFGDPTCSSTTGSVQLPGIAVIVATQNNTSVVVATTGAIGAGQGLTAQGGTVTMNQGDVLQISTAENAAAACAYGSDISGSTVVASAPVEVFGGSDCQYIPASEPACDHLEQINFPLETLRGDYLVTLPYNHNGTPRQYVKIVGTAAATAITTNPVQAGIPATIGAGQVAFFETTTDFSLTTSEPVIVGQFMESSSQFGTACASGDTGSPTDCGDPSLSLAIATDQFRTSYQFIAPPSYAENWVNVIAPAAATVTVDGVAVTGFTAIGNSGFDVAHVSLCANGGTCTGVHTATSSMAFGIEVYGYGVYTSYMYPGGLDLKRE